MQNFCVTLAVKEYTAPLHSMSCRALGEPEVVVDILAAAPAVIDEAPQAAAALFVTTTTHADDDFLKNVRKQSGIDVDEQAAIDNLGEPLQPKRVRTEPVQCPAPYANWSVYRRCSPCVPPR